MKITHAIMSCNSDPTYLEFWPIVSKIWVEKFNIIPVLAYINDGPFTVSQDYGYVFNIKYNKEYPISIQSLWARYWYGAQLNSNMIISDIDMIPLSRWYFIENIKEIPDNKYIHINPALEYKDASNTHMLPSCYHVSNGALFNEILEIADDTWETSLRKVQSLPLTPVAGCPESWFKDEKYATLKINNYTTKHPDKIVFKQRPGGQNGHRIDRANWSYYADRLKNEYYYDCHSVRPYSRYKKDINYLLDIFYGKI